PIARPVSLPSEEHARLESLVRAHSTPQALAFRCRLILRTAAPDRPSNLQVATEMACERHTVGRWRQRYLAHGLSGLPDASRSGRPPPRSPRGALPPSARVAALSRPTGNRGTFLCPATRWSLDDLVAALLQHRLQPMS